METIPSFGWPVALQDRRWQGVPLDPCCVQQARKSIITPSAIRTFESLIRWSRLLFSSHPVERADKSGGTMDARWTMQNTRQCAYTGRKWRGVLDCCNARMMAQDAQPPAGRNCPEYVDAAAMRHGNQLVVKMNCPMAFRHGCQLRGTTANIRTPCQRFMPVGGLIR